MSRRYFLTIEVGPVQREKAKALAKRWGLSVSAFFRVLIEGLCDGLPQEDISVCRICKRQVSLIEACRLAICTRCLNEIEFKKSEGPNDS
jgi:hypothetical protein